MTGLPNRPGHDEASEKSQPKVEIYTTRHCGYCVRAKQFLHAREIVFIEHAIDGDAEARGRMMERAGGRRTIPQIFIDDRAIGGFMELYQLYSDGQLDVMLRRVLPTNGVNE